LDRGKGSRATGARIVPVTDSGTLSGCGEDGVGGEGGDVSDVVTVTVTASCPFPAFSSSSSSSVSSMRFGTGDTPADLSSFTIAKYPDGPDGRDEILVLVDASSSVTIAL